MTKHIDIVISELNAEASRVSKRRAPNELKLLSSADWGDRPYIEVSKDIIDGLAEHIRRIESELAAARKELANNKPVSVNVTVNAPASKAKFQIGDRVRATLSPKHRYVVTGTEDGGWYSVTPTTAGSYDTRRQLTMTERTPLAEFIWTDLKVGDTVQYKNFRYVIEKLEYDFATAKAKNDSFLFFNLADFESKSVIVVDTPQ